MSFSRRNGMGLRSACNCRSSAPRYREGRPRTCRGEKVGARPGFRETIDAGPFAALPPGPRHTRLIAGTNARRRLHCDIAKSPRKRCEGGYLRRAVQRAQLFTGTVCRMDFSADCGGRFADSPRQDAHPTRLAAMSRAPPHPQLPCTLPDAVVARRPIGRFACS
jgi:hypothetical protein